MKAAFFCFRLLPPPTARAKIFTRLIGPQTLDASEVRQRLLLSDTVCACRLQCSEHS